LSEVEVVSAFARLHRDGGITTAETGRAAQAFVNDIRAWHVVELTPDVTSIARRLLLQHQLRSGDALQLASALHLQAGIGIPLESFIAFDVGLLEAARSEQLVVTEV